MDYMKIIIEKKANILNVLTRTEVTLHAVPTHFVGNFVM